MNPERSNLITKAMFKLKQCSTVKNLRLTKLASPRQGGAASYGMKKTILFSALSTLALPLLSFAQDIPIGYDKGKDKDPSIFIDVFQKIGNWLFTFLLILAVIMILIAAYKYLFSGGGEKVKEANKMLIYAVVALAVGSLSASIPWLIKQVVDQPEVGDHVPEIEVSPEVFVR